MKILVFEHITGGGFNKQELPESLAEEGRLMLNGLLDCFLQLKNIELLIMLDWRVSTLINTAGMSTFIVTSEHHTLDEFLRLANQCDAVWPLAPEFDSILQNLCQHVESLNKLLLTSPAAAVAMTGNKYETFKQLIRHKIATVDTRLFDAECYAPGEWMVKPIDGAGCNDSYLLNERQDFALLAGQLGKTGRYIIQPHIRGEKTSLSCLFRQGHGWLLSVNLQKFKLIAKQYHLVEIVVNHHSDLNRYQNIMTDIAQAFPDLWGYAGIDLIETTEEINVLEINPRLTTSFVGIQAALGINTCLCVLDLLKSNPAAPRPKYNKSVTIKIK
jgi:predicted ATP-grasp superfamily ATP-dependent carboligase